MAFGGHFEKWLPNLPLYLKKVRRHLLIVANTFADQLNNFVAAQKLTFKKILHNNIVTKMAFGGHFGGHIEKKGRQNDSSTVQSAQSLINSCQHLCRPVS